MSRATMQVVDLDDARAGHETPTRASHRRRWWALAVGGLLVVVALVVAQRTLDARDRAALAALAAVPGVLAPVDGHLDVVRGAPAAELGAPEPEGSVVQDLDGSQSYVWPPTHGAADDLSVPLLGPTPALAAVGQVYAGTACQTADDRVVCLVSDGGIPQGDTAGFAPILPTQARVVAFSARDGSPVAAWPIDAGGTFVLDDGTIVVASRTHGTVTVASHDVVTGRLRWQTQLGDRAPGAQDGVLDPVGVTIVGDWLVMKWRGDRATVLTRDGRLARVVQFGGDDVFRGWTTTLGRLAYAGVGPDGTPTTTILSADDEPRHDVVLAGQEVVRSVDDASLPGLALTTDGTLRAWDAGTGESRWDVPVSVMDARAIVLGGRVYVAGPQGVVALEGRSGRQVWASTVSDRMHGALSIYTDGRNILLPLDAVGGTARAELVAYDALTGEVAFRARYPEGISGLVGTGHQLAGYDEESESSVLIE